MLHLVLGRAKTGKTTQLLTLIGQNGAQRPQVLIVPEQYSHETERHLCQTVGNRSAAFCEVLSFTRLANRVFSATGHLSEPVLDAGGRLLLMHEAVQAVAGQLTVYRKPSKKAAFLQDLLATADELKSYCVLPEQLLTAAREDATPETERMHDLGLILGAYDGLVSQRAADPRDCLTRMADALSECDYGRGWDFYLDCFTDFTPQQRAVLEKLLRRAHSVTVALTCSSLEQYDLTREPFRKTALSLLSMAREAHIPTEHHILLDRRDNAPQPLCALETELFSTDAPKTPPTDSHAEQCIHLLRADNPYQEVEAVAGEIVRLTRDCDLRWRDITVASRTLERYEDLIERIFERYQIPVFLGKVDDILQKPILTLITAALDTVSGGYEYEDLFRYLKTGLAGISLAEVDLLENYALCWTIRGNKWTQEQDWSWHPVGYGLPWTDPDRELVKQLDSLRRTVIAPLEALKSTPNGTGLALVQALYDFLESIELPQRLTDRAQALQERGDLQQADEYRQLWDILCGAMEQCATLMGDAELSMAQFAELFRLVLSQYSVGTIPVSLDRVSAGEMQRFAHKQTKVLFLLGVDDSQFPLVTQSAGLLTDDDRVLLTDLGCELAPSADQRLDRETAMACDAVCIPQQQLYMSYPHHSGSSECRPAALLQRTLCLFPTLSIADPDPALRWGAPLPALDEAARTGNTALYALLHEDSEWGERTQRMQSAAQHKRGSLSRPAVDALYGKQVHLSASKLEKMKSCHFSYFMQYGLKAKARKAAGFEAPQVGIFVHYVLEHVLREARTMGGVKALSRDELKPLIERSVSDYIKEELGGLERESPRFRYLFRRLSTSVTLIVYNVADELRRSEFEPRDFELGFGLDNHTSLPPIRLKEQGMTLSISGLVDRVDGWEHNGRLYLRVVDYKTGRKSFSLTQVWHGLELQMLLYLFALEQEGHRIYHQDIVSSGVLYLPARDDILSGTHSMTEAERQKELDTQLKRSGMLLNDPAVIHAMENIDTGGKPRFLPVTLKKDGSISGDSLATAEQWGKLHRHVQRTLRDIAGELANGNVAADPYLTSNNLTPCDYCDFKQACHFESAYGEDCQRYLYKMTNDKFFANYD